MSVVGQLELIQLATADVASFLNAQLPELSPNWWQRHVLDRLSFQQQRTARERGFTKLQQLDFAALLRILDQNWHELSAKCQFPREARSWVRELQTVRNKWAHLSAEALPASETYRDTDTLGRLLTTVGASPVTLKAIETAKAAALALMVAPSPRGAPIKLDKALQVTVTAEPTKSLFKIGDLVALRSNPDISMPVIEVISGGVECRYRVFHNNGKSIYYESQLQGTDLAKDDVRKVLNSRELCALLTSSHILSPSTANLFSFHLGRVKFVPYQYRPVLKLIRADRPRLLIADEVGVGKTIEAGLIIKELRARMDISSVLVICPKALVAERKWFTEMKRFDEHFTALDGPMLRHCLQETHLDGEWPEQYAKAILPFSLFDSDLVFGRTVRSKNRDQGLLALDPPPKFDLVIVDEAHHLRNSETFLHHGVRYFCDNAGAVIFLTATPIQLGSEDLYTLLNVLRPDLVIDQASFEQMSAPNRPINIAVQHCRSGQSGWQHEARACMNQVAETEWGRLFLRESSAFQEIYDRLKSDSIPDSDRVGLVHAIEELYTFRPFINRTRRRDIGEFTTRKPETVTIEFTSAQKKLHDELLDVVARILTFCHGQQNVKFMMTTIRRQAASCLYGLAPLLEDILTGKLNRLELMETSDSDEDLDLSFVAQVQTDIASLLEQARKLPPNDPKVEGYVKVLVDKSKLPNNKALVFSTFRHTLAYLAHHTQRSGLRYGLIHGDVPDEERTDLRRRFALPKEDLDALDVLLSSEVGCEGLDFQFCDCLINYDLPWNPMRIEQRIGRIDRYGQKSETIAIVNFITPGTVDADIYQRCLWRIGVFQHAIGGNEEILGEISEELHNIAESFTLTPKDREQRLRQLADNGIRQIREEQELESRQAELFGLSVPNQAWQQEIKAAESCWLSPQSLQRCVSSYLTARLAAGAEAILGEGDLKTLRLSQEARGKLLEDYKRLPRTADTVAREWEKWLKGSQPTLAVTFNQESAAESSKTVHLSVIHPLVRQAAYFLQPKEPVFVSLKAQSTDIPEGTYRFVIYRWRKYGVRADEALVLVGDVHAVENELLTLIQTATETVCSKLPSQAEFDALDSHHYAKWTTAQANHIAENRREVEYRIQSLTVSHRARCRAIEDQIARTTNDKIRLMKQSELARANADFNRRLTELQQAANSGDIQATAMVFGSISIVKEDKR